jgi:diguanylate cyclase (GGDEF)-like protein
MDRLSQLECGIYLLARDDPGLEFLLEANRTIREVIKTLVAEAQFPVIARRLAEIAGQFLGSTTLEFWARAGPTALHFDSEDDFAGRVTEPTELITQGFAGVPATAGRELIVPLRASLSGEVVGVIVLGFDGTPTLDRATRAILGQIADLVEVGLEREVMRRVADLDRETFYEQATHDPLTGLYNRTYSSEVAERLCATDDRTEGSHMAALMIDIDHFKRVNDTYGHQAGDRVLQRVAGAMTQAIRPGDVAVRFGGEEFLVLLGDVDGATSVAVAERIRSAVAAPDRAVSDGEAATPEERTPAVTASVGVALRRQGETFEGLVERADVSLYRAKSNGRDQVAVAP